MNPIHGKKIILGITGSIAAYKGAELASKLTQSGAAVQTILTEAAVKFISPLTFQSLTGEKAYTDQDLWGSKAHVLHVSLARNADMILVAPATATTIAKLANGLADNLLTITALAGGGQKKVPVVIAPAMDGGMYSNPATQENIQRLSQRGAVFIGPEEGHLASGLTGKGRMTEPQEIQSNIRFLFSRNGDFKEIKLVITAGGTIEDLDPVRFISNRSSGKQGYAIAQAALDSGAEVTLITAPVNLKPPFGAEIIAIRNASEMKNAVLENCKDADVICMAAAVSDYRPSMTLTEKIKKEGNKLILPLETTDDILLELSKYRKENDNPVVVVGFAAESEKLIENAKSKLKSKDLDFIVANDITAKNAGFGSETNQVTFLFPDGHQDKLPMLTKYEVGEQIIQKVYEILEKNKK